MLINRFSPASFPDFYIHHFTACDMLGCFSRYLIKQGNQLSILSPGLLAICYHAQHFYSSGNAANLKNEYYSALAILPD